MQNVIRIDFEEIYRSNGFQGNESISGPGSSVANTCFLRAKLAALLLERNIQSMLDIPCGDCNWMHLVKMPTVKRYLGADIIQELIDKNTAAFGPTLSFRRLNILEDSLPTYDLVFCRDCFVHLPFEDIFRALTSIKKSDGKWLMLTTFPKHTENLELTSGIWRPLNMQIAPFNFPDPEEIFMENPGGDSQSLFPDKSIGLWDINALRLDYKS